MVERIFVGFILISKHPKYKHLELPSSFSLYFSLYIFISDLLPLNLINQNARGALATAVVATLLFVQHSKPSCLFDYLNIDYIALIWIQRMREKIVVSIIMSL